MRFDETPAGTVQAANLCHLRSDFHAPAATPEQLADLLRKHGPLAEKDAKAVRRTVKTDTIKDSVKDLTKSSKSFEKLLKAHLKSPEEGAWKNKLEPAILELITLADTIIKAAEAPIDDLTKELRDFDKASADIALLSNYTQSVARSVLGIRSAYSDYLNTSSQNAADTFQLYLGDARTELGNLDTVRTSAGKNTSDKALNDLLNGPLKALVTAGGDALPKLEATFAEVVTSTAALRASEQSFAAAASSLTEQAEIISANSGATALASAVGAQTQITITLALALLLGDTVHAVESFDRHMPQEVPRVALVDTFKDEVEESLRDHLPGIADVLARAAEGLGWLREFLEPAYRAASAREDSQA